MKRALILIVVAVAAGLAGFLIGRKRAKVPADWQGERVAVYGQLRDLTERNRELESLLKRAQSRAATKPAGGTSRP